MSESQAFPRLGQQFPRGCVEKRHLRRLEALETLDIAFLTGESGVVWGFAEQAGVDALQRFSIARKREQLSARLTHPASLGWNPPPRIHTGNFIFRGPRVTEAAEAT